MALRNTIENVDVFGPSIWGAHLTAAEVRHIGEGKVRGRRRSVICVTGALYNPETRLLSFSPEHAEVFSIGSTDEVVIIDLGAEAPVVAAGIAGASALTIRPLGPVTDTFGSSDVDFIAKCKGRLPKLANMGEEIIKAIRRHYPGKMKEHNANKWVNHPDNFLAITIQHMDQSFAIHVKGRPEQFTAPSLNIKRDRGSYCRFKLQREEQLQDAIKVILASKTLPLEELEDLQAIYN